MGRNMGWDIFSMDIILYCKVKGKVIEDGLVFINILWFKIVKKIML